MNPMKAGSYQFLFDVEEPTGAQVFQDATHHRGRKLRRLTLALVCVFASWMMLFLNGVVSLTGITDELRFWWEAQAMPVVRSIQTGEADDGHEHLHFYGAPETAHGHEADVDLNAASAIPVSTRAAGPFGCPAVTEPAFAAHADTAGGLEVMGYMSTAVDEAPLSLERSCGAVDVLVPDWFTVKQAGNGLMVEAENDEVREPVEQYRVSHRDGARLLPTVSLSGGADVAEMVKRLEAPGMVETVASELDAQAAKLGADGVCVDFGQMAARELKVAQPLLDGIADALHAGGRTSCIVLRLEQEIWRDAGRMDKFDRVVLQAFRAPWVGTAPGALADSQWFEALTREALDTIGADKLTLALGAFAVDWTQRIPMPEQIAFGEAAERLNAAGAELRFSPETGNAFASYRDGEGRAHKLWVLDAVSAHNQIRTAEALGVRSVGVWPMGREDPGLWQVLTIPSQERDTLAAALSELNFDSYVSYEGAGPFLRVLSEPQSGVRLIAMNDETGQIDNVTYARLPKPFKMERYGRPAAGKLVLTFDDGPTVEYTTKILDSLAETGTKGSFFIVGAQAIDKPGLLRRIVDEGHEIGGHSFSHPRMDQISYSRAEVEHRMTAKLIAGYTGHHTRLYREPFLRAGGPVDALRVPPLMVAQNEGDIIAGMDIVPEDWTGMSADEIVDYVVTRVNRGEGNVILLHDGGGANRNATVAAVPRLIEALTAQGYEFTTLADLLGVSRAELMPEAGNQWTIFDRVSFEFMAVVWAALKGVFWVVLMIGLLRMSAILVMAHIRRRTPPVDNGYAPKVTVVIPAHNEEAGIANTLRSVLASDYENFDVMVVDDGSIDDTFDEVLKFRTNPKVKIFAQLNQGKWAALNAAAQNADAEVLVCIDADTQIHPSAIRHLAKQFANPRVGAVAGKIRVANRRGLLTRLQALEYVTAQNFDRRAYDLLNGIMVVPGAIGAWRLQAIKEAGLYTRDTITEDADLTIAVNRAGWRVTYEERAVAYTEAPESLRQLLAQRLRWTLGMFQCAWKHKGAFGEKRSVGLVSIPDMLIFGYLFPLLAPIADLFVVILVVKYFQGNWEGDVGTAVASAPTHLLWAYIALPMLDFFVAAYALWTDKDERIWSLWLFPFQRFFYRQVLYFSVWRSVLRAATGSLAGWGRMKRKGRVFALGAAT